MAELENNKAKSSSSSSGSMFLSRSFTVHATSAKSYHPLKVHLFLNNPSLNRVASISKIYNSIDSDKGKVKKLCSLFESSKSSSTLARPKEPFPKVVLRPMRSIGYSLQGIRRTYEDCYAVRMIFKGFTVWVDERNISMDAAYKKELQSILKLKNLSLPQVFIKGKYVGGADVIKSMFEVGELAKTLNGFSRRQSGLVCEGCGDARFVPCGNCSGSQKVFDKDEGLPKRCLECNENRLIRCSDCCS
ncbi:hypothetical protein PTKIN_Ptkin01aG0255200 [Pterospermum kingtungense]